MARVLVVEDDPDIRSLVEARVRRHGHQVVVASSGEEAVDVVEKEGLPDVAVLDVSMPGMTGFELLKKLRARDDGDALPVIFLSARVQPEDIATGQALGARYLTKPFVASALLEAIEASLPASDAEW